jgi:hypothetical protein
VAILKGTSEAKASPHPTQVIISKYIISNSHVLFHRDDATKAICCGYYDLAINDRRACLETGVGRLDANWSPAFFAATP